MITPTKKRLILKPSDSEMRGTMFIPEGIKHRMSTSCKVVARGPEVNPAVKVGNVVLCRVGVDRSKTIDRTASFWSSEDSIYAIVRNQTILPIGKTVLIRRDVQETEVGGIVIPENRRSQSLEGWVVRRGLYQGQTGIEGIIPGRKIRLTEWQPHMVQVRLEDQSEGLIVLESDILFCYE